jgi:hypothetical protein
MNHLFIAYRLVMTQRIVELHVKHICWSATDLRMLWFSPAT